ncbi:MAG: general secretion pathway protein GspF [Deltaproteobacteria bacterium]|nr:general secretion pathway protein GspF [Deltaproteobacteria bacterium]
MNPLKRLRKTPILDGEGKESDGPMFHPDHPRPVSRRQFLGQGFITGAAYVAAPSILSLLGARDAFAQASCALTGAGAGKIPFIGFDLGGGANIAGSNVMVGGPLGQEDLLTEAGYEVLGLPLDMTPLNSQITALDRTLNLAFHFDSALLRGMLDKASVAALAKVEGVIIPSRSSNDTQNNPLNPIYGIFSAGADGGLLSLIGTESTESGGNSIVPPAQFMPELRPTKIDRPSDVTGLVDTGKLSQLLGRTGSGQVADAIQAISALKVEQIQEDQVVKDLVNCAYQQSNDLITLFGSPDALDPLQDPIIFNDDPINLGQPIFSAADLNQSEFRKTASVMKLVCEGHAGAGTIEFGGYDYHGGTRSRGELKDFTAGQAIGACIEFAERNPLVGDLMIYLFSDGSVSSDGQIDNSADGRGKGAWQSDSSATASAVLLVYRKSGKPDLMPAYDPSRQIGYFRPTGAVETSTNAAANNPEALTQLVILNYMALHGDTPGDFNALFPGNALQAEAANLVAFQAIRP